MSEHRIRGHHAAEGVFQQQLIGVAQQTIEGALIVRRKVVVVVFEKILQQEIELQHAAAAVPGKARALRSGGRRGTVHTMCFSISSLISPMALVGLRPLGHTSTQFMMVWQRNNRYGPSNSLKRSAVAWSRLSARKRYACSSAAGPRNLSGFHQNDGQAVEQQAHRIHSYKPSSLSRCAGRCRYSTSVSGSCTVSQGLTDRYRRKNCLKSTTRSRITGMPGRGQISPGTYKSFNGV